MGLSSHNLLFAFTAPHWHQLTSNAASWARLGDPSAQLSCQLPLLRSHVLRTARQTLFSLHQMGLSYELLSQITTANDDVTSWACSSGDPFCSALTSAITTPELLCSMLPLFSPHQMTLGGLHASVHSSLLLPPLRGASSFLVAGHKAQASHALARGLCPAAAPLPRHPTNL